MTETLSPTARAWFSTPGPLTDLGPHHFDLPLDGNARPKIADVVTAVQGLVIYDAVSKPFYGVTLSAERAEDIQIRPVAELLDRAVKTDGRPLTEPRPPDRRVTGRCRTFTVLTVAILRAHGIPARARCGFGAAFRPGWFEDHWVAQYWSDAETRWVMVDAQLDAAWVKALGYTGDPLDVTADEFVTAGRAWMAWRSGATDPDRYGLSSINEHGAFWIAGNLRLDITALAKIEMLPWDVWGAGWEPYHPIPDDLTLFDTMAGYANDADSTLDQIRDLADRHPGVRMPGRVFNVIRQGAENVLLAD